MIKALRFMYPAMFVVALLVMGCPKKPLVKPTVVEKVEAVRKIAEPRPRTVRKPTVRPTQAPTPVAEALPEHQWDVVKGNTLWDIAGDEAHYSDSFLWPAIYKANRDQIVDPDLIEVGWRLHFPKVLTIDEAEQAHQRAFSEPEKHK